MKDRFIEKDGMLFMRFDELNKGQVVISYDKGSVLWALEQIMYGKKVKRDTGAVYSDSGTGIKREGKETNTISRRLFISNNINATDFKICREPKFKVGDWVKNKNTGEYCQIVGVNSGSKYAMQVREAGSNTAIMAAVEHYEPASLNPDFSKAKVGDKVFSMANGYTEIEDVDEPSDPYPIEVNDEWHMSDGRISEYTLYPIVFNDHHQAKAYFDELFMKLDEEQR